MIWRRGTSAATFTAAVTLVTACGVSGSGPQAARSGAGAYGPDPCGLRAPASFAVNGQVVQDGVHAEGQGPVKVRPGDPVHIDVGYAPPRGSLGSVDAYLMAGGGSTGSGAPPQAGSYRSSQSMRQKDDRGHIVGDVPWGSSGPSDPDGHYAMRFLLHVEPAAGGPAVCAGTTLVIGTVALQAASQ